MHGPPRAFAVSGCSTTGLRIDEEAIGGALRHWFPFLPDEERLANVLKDLHRPHEAVEQLEAALEEARQEWGWMDVRAIDLMAPLATHLSTLGRQQEAVDLFENLHRRPEARKDPRRMFSLISLGSLRAVQKQYEAADVPPLAQRSPSQALTAFLNPG